MRAIPISAGGHPLRKNLGLAAARTKRRAKARASDDDDFKLFALSYTAFFVCFYTFII